ncbi:MAG: 4Fe-4S dicluster domain-containing protein, partial [Candidatus Glassbacteria bacterium]
MGEKRNEISRRSFLFNAAVTGPLLFVLGPKVLKAQVEKTPEGEELIHYYAMGIQVNKCIGCGRCVSGCKIENNVPKDPFYFRTWVERYIITVEGEVVVDSPAGGMNGFQDLNEKYSILRSFFIPKLCNHCG